MPFLNSIYFFITNQLLLPYFALVVSLIILISWLNWSKTKNTENTFSLGYLRNVRASISTGCFWTENSIYLFRKNGWFETKHKRIGSVRFGYLFLQTRIQIIIPRKQIVPTLTRNDLLLPTFFKNRTNIVSPLIWFSLCLFWTEKMWCLTNLFSSKEKQFNNCHSETIIVILTSEKNRPKMTKTLGFSRIYKFKISKTHVRNK